MSVLHRPAPHESAWLHVRGLARYVDDLPMPAGGLHAAVVRSSHAHARIDAVDVATARGMSGVRGVFVAADVPGHLHVGPIAHDEELLATELVHHVGQPIAVVVADTLAAARAAARAVQVRYSPLAAITTIDAAIAADQFLTTPHRIERGDVDGALQSASLRIAGEMRCGGQDHFYLETQAALVVPEEGGSFKVYSSTQHPSEVQAEVAAVLGVGRHQVICEVPRLGGGFGGKESQASPVACLAAVASWHLGRPVKLWLDRDEDMAATGKRHPFLGRYEAGFDANGRLVALVADLYSDGGFSLDLSGAILDRALFHLDNAYFVPNARFTGRVCRTNLPSNTAFRGFGGPQGVLVVEDAMHRAAELTGRDPAWYREHSFYGPGRDTTPYGQRVEDPRAQRIWLELRRTSDYDRRLAQVGAFNASSGHRRRGIGVQPVKFGISFTNAMLNQAGALVHWYADGSVQLNHGGIEMGQGLHTKMIAVCADALGVLPSSVRVMNTSTEKVPNTSATAASSGSDLNGAAIRNACEALVARVRPVAADLLGVEVSSVTFGDGFASAAGRRVALTEVVRTCWVRRISLSSAGYYQTPGIAYDRDRGQGTPFYYFAWGAAVVEVEVDGLTGEHRLLRTDILHDVGDSLVPTIDRGQVEGGFVQGLGWLTMEEVLFDASGRCLTHGPSTYKIPAVGDVPLDFRVALLADATEAKVIGGSKAVGEPPLILGIAAISALRQAIAAFGPGGVAVPLALPATPEAILRAIVDVQSA
jgi:xanthine dehydrogenase large subunit